MPAPRGASPPPRRSPQRDRPRPPPLPKLWGSMKGHWRRQKSRDANLSPAAMRAQGHRPREEDAIAARYGGEDSSSRRLLFPKSEHAPTSPVSSTVLNQLFAPNARPLRPNSSRVFTTSERSPRPPATRGARSARARQPCGLRRVFEHDPAADAASQRLSGPIVDSLAALWEGDLADQRKAGVRSGFERFRRSLARVVGVPCAGSPRAASPSSPTAAAAAEAASSESLSERWESVSRWIDQFAADETGSALSRRAEGAIAAVYATDKERGRPHPNQATTGMALAVLDPLLLLLERYQPRLGATCRAVRREVAGAVYVQAPAVESEDSGRLSPLLDSSMAEDRWDLLCSQRLSATAGAKTWYSACRELISRMDRTEEDILSAERRKEKQLAATDRAIAFWQLELLKMVLRGWHKCRIRQREEAEARKREQQRDVEVAELKRALRDAREKRESEAMKFEAEKKVLTDKIAEYIAQNQKLQQKMKETSARERQLYEEISSLKSELATVQTRLVGSEEECREYSKLLKNTVKHCLEGPEWEVRQQEVVAQHVSGDTFTDSRMLDWLNETAMRGAELAKNVVADLGVVVDPAHSFLDVFKLFDLYGLAMHWMSPHQITQGMLRAVLGASDEAVKAEAVLGCAGALGVIVPLSVIEIAAPRASVQHVVITATLFRRFADCGLALSCDIDPLKGPCGAEEPHPLWLRDDPETPAQWEERVNESWSRLCKWRAAGAAAESVALDVVLGKLLHRGQRFLSDLELAQMADYCEDPVDAKSDAFGGIEHLFPEDKGERAEQIDHVKHLIKSEYPVLRKIYRFYASGDSRDEDVELSLDEAWRMIGDAELGKGIKKKTVQKLFDRANTNVQGRRLSERSDRSDTSSSDGESTLNPAEWVQLLLHLSAAKVKDKPIAERFHDLLQTHVLPNVNWSVAEEFKQEVYRPDVQNVLLKYRGFAQAVFDWYVKDGNKGRKMSADDRRLMRMDTFVDVINDLRIVDSVLTHNAVRQTFLKLQDSTETGDARASFHVFLECLCAIALFKLPAPFLPVHQRIARFFRMFFVPMLTDQLAARMPGFRSPMPRSLSPTPRGTL